MSCPRSAWRGWEKEIPDDPAARVSGTTPLLLKREQLGLHARQRLLGRRLGGRGGGPGGVVHEPGLAERVGGEESDDAEGVEIEAPPETTTGRRKVGKIKLTSQDQKFLRALKISIDDEGR